MKSLIKNLTLIVLASAGLMLGQGVMAEISIIVHPDNKNDLTEKYIKRLFLTKSEVFPNGDKAIPLVLNKNHVAHDLFVASFIKKSAHQYDSYWGRLIFTGKGAPPKGVSDHEAMKKLISTNPNTIGYIDSALVDSSVREVFKF
ncbi:MAG: phosphate ABC transporter substrate-binding protein [Gammaproteobacteria bacterium]|nr:MAG: phosphate ABC transporter substrate-binding protein [Gammaproteobacteria bacterium]